MLRREGATECVKKGWGGWSSLRAKVVLLLGLAIRMPRESDPAFAEAEAEAGARALACG